MEARYPPPAPLPFLLHVILPPEVPPPPEHLPRGLDETRLVVVVVGAGAGAVAASGLLLVVLVAEPCRLKMVLKMVLLHCKITARGRRRRRALPLSRVMLMSPLLLFLLLPSLLVIVFLRLVMSSPLVVVAGVIGRAVAMTQPRLPVLLRRTTPR